MDFKETAKAGRYDPRLRRSAIFARIAWSDFLLNTYLL
jgi:hypothetical protein